MCRIPTRRNARAKKSRLWRSTPRLTNTSNPRPSRRRRKQGLVPSRPTEAHGPNTRTLSAWRVQRRLDLPERKGGRARLPLRLRRIASNRRCPRLQSRKQTTGNPHLWDKERSMTRLKARKKLERRRLSRRRWHRTVFSRPPYLSNQQRVTKKLKGHALAAKTGDRLKRIWRRLARWREDQTVFGKVQSRANQGRSNQARVAQARARHLNEKTRGPLFLPVALRLPRLLFTAPKPRAQEGKWPKHPRGRKSRRSRIKRRHVYRRPRYLLREVNYPSATSGPGPRFLHVSRVHGVYMMILIVAGISYPLLYLFQYKHDGCWWKRWSRRWCLLSSVINSLVC